MKALSLREITANLNTREETKQVVWKGGCRKWLLECSKIGFHAQSSDSGSELPIFT